MEERSFFSANLYSILRGCQTGFSIIGAVWRLNRESESFDQSATIFGARNAERKMSAEITCNISQLKGVWI